MVQCYNPWWSIALLQTCSVQEAIETGVLQQASVLAVAWFYELRLRATYSAATNTYRPPGLTNPVWLFSITSIVPKYKGHSEKSANATPQWSPCFRTIECVAVNTFISGPGRERESPFPSISTVVPLPRVCWKKKGGNNDSTGGRQVSRQKSRATSGEYHKLT